MAKVWLYAVWIRSDTANIIVNDKNCIEACKAWKFVSNDNTHI